MGIHMDKVTKMVYNSEIMKQRLMTRSALMAEVDRMIHGILS